MPAFVVTVRCYHDDLDKAVICAHGTVLEAYPEPEDLWAEDADYPRKEWQKEVCHDNTQLGYWAWVQHQKDEDDD